MEYFVVSPQKTSTSSFWRILRDQMRVKFRISHNFVNQPVYQQGGKLVGKNALALIRRSRRATIFMIYRDTRARLISRFFQTFDDRSDQNYGRFRDNFRDGKLDACNVQFNVFIKAVVLAKPLAFDYLPELGLNLDAPECKPFDSVAGGNVWRIGNVTIVLGRFDRFDIFQRDVCKLLGKRFPRKEHFNRTVRPEYQPFKKLAVISPENHRELLAREQKYMKFFYGRETL